MEIARQSLNSTAPIYAQFSSVWLHALRSLRSDTPLARYGLLNSLTAVQ